VLAHVKELEAKLAASNLSAAVPATGISEPRASYATAPKTTAPAPSSQPVAAAGGGDPGDLWGRVMTELRSKKPGIFSALGHSSIIRLTDSELVIGIQGSAFQVGKIEEQESRDIIEQVAGAILNKKVRVKVQAVEAPSKPNAKTKDPQKAKHTEHDALAQDVAKLFGGEVVETDDPEA
jgi:hypothetical protein